MSDKQNKIRLVQAYRKMKLIREFEEKLHAENATGDIPGFIHLYSGEEAIAVGICDELKNYRLHRLNTQGARALYCKGM
ncbi:Pyruvate dehydrogenase (acetyl-transferring) [Salmonella enterica subsp. enterica serovar Newport str. CVM 4176]|nr:Pyruvate dehydrogenase (acetyl-transferring) [Salmonella enterica subsp. enterica serovar Newport str. CVM 4176]